MTDVNSRQGEHFDFKKLAPGVYAAIAIEQAGIFGNCGIIDTGDHTIVFDTSESTASARELKIMAESLTRRPVNYVIFSHAHPDHVFGAQVFSDRTPIISTLGTRLDILGLDDYAKDNRQAIDEWVGYLEEQQAKFAAEADDKVRAHLSKSIARIQRTIDDIPTLELRFPTITFEHELVFHGRDRSVVLITRGGGHTNSDCYLLLDGDRILFAGDLAFFQRQPYMGDCDLPAWLMQIEALVQLDIDVVVPGHGQVGNKSDLIKEKEYLSTIENMVKEGLNAGLEIDRLLNQSLPEPFDRWSVDGRPSEPNVRYLYERLMGKDSHG